MTGDLGEGEQAEFELRGALDRERFACARRGIGFDVFVVGLVLQHPLAVERQADTVLADMGDDGGFLALLHGDLDHGGRLERAGAAEGIEAEADAAPVAGVEAESMVPLAEREEESVVHLADETDANVVLFGQLVIDPQDAIGQQRQRFAAGLSGRAAGDVGGQFDEREQVDLGGAAGGGIERLDGLLGVGYAELGLEVHGISLGMTGEDLTAEVAHVLPGVAFAGICGADDAAAVEVGEVECFGLGEFRNGPGREHGEGTEERVGAGGELGGFLRLVGVDEAELNVFGGELGVGGLATERVAEGREAALGGEAGLGVADACADLGIARRWEEPDDLGGPAEDGEGGLGPVGVDFLIGDDEGPGRRGRRRRACACRSWRRGRGPRGR